ncbi:hypothetical protein RCZ01_24090 [Capnocytophaga felis]|uniref:Uncharacterized protein n=2 Tax=Capnocytophaga felis TaxID=2267611 RepID=A0A5M4BCV1_9FLAO|nr:hypothetical protein RCZ01_24090 [Capnocytophaga felis]GET49668.1 hypothetical protein RCZ02_24990 [Capnocytophaga felis]
MCQYYEKIETGRFGGSKRIDGLIGVGGFIAIHWATIIFLSKNTFLEKYINKILSIPIYTWAGKIFYLVVFSTIILGFLYFLVGKKYHEIYNRYNQETITQRKKRGWIIILYLFITFSLFGYSIYRFNQNATKSIFINENPIKMNELIKELKENKK